MQNTRRHFGRRRRRHATRGRRCGGGGTQRAGTRDQYDRIYHRTSKRKRKRTESAPSPAAPVRLGRGEIIDLSVESSETPSPAEDAIWNSYTLDDHFVGNDAEFGAAAFADSLAPAAPGVVAEPVLVVSDGLTMTPNSGTSKQWSSLPDYPSDWSASHTLVPTPTSPASPVPVMVPVTVPTTDRAGELPRRQRTMREQLLVDFDNMEYVPDVFQTQPRLVPVVITTTTTRQTKNPLHVFPFVDNDAFNNVLQEVAQPVRPATTSSSATAQPPTVMAVGPAATSAVGTSPLPKTPAVPPAWREARKNQTDASKLKTNMTWVFNPKDKVHYINTVAPATEHYTRANSQLYTEIKKHIEGYVNRTSTPCGTVTKDYIFEGFNKVHAIGVLRKENQRSAFLGYTFVCFSAGGKIINANDVPDGIYVYVLCGHPKFYGVGKLIVGAIEDLARRNGIHKIHLENVEPSYDFYINRGFSCELGVRQACVKDKMVKHL